MWSSCIRRRLSSQAAIRWWRERPWSFGPRTGREARLGGDEEPVAPPLQRLAEHFLRGSVGVGVGGVDEVDPHVETKVELALGRGHVDVADVGEAAAAAEAHGPEGQLGDAKARAAELAVAHGRQL